jgi:hypothetical protein
LSLPVAGKKVFLKVEDFGFGSQIDEMGAPIQNHIGKKFGLVHLTGLGAGNSDPDGDLMLHQIGQIVIGAIARGGFAGQIPGRVGPSDPVVNEKQINLMPLGMGDLAELKTAGGLFHIILAQNK